MENDYINNISFYLARCYFEIVLVYLSEQANDLSSNHFIISLQDAISFYFIYILYLNK